MKSRKKLAKEILKDLIFEPTTLSTNKGRHIHDPITRRITKKDRRHSGHRIVFAEDKDYPVMIDTYDDWVNYRDSMRDKWAIKKIKRIYPQMFYSDEERYWNLRKEINKINKHEKIRIVFITLQL